MDEKRRRFAKEHNIVKGKRREDPTIDGIDDVQQERQVNYRSLPQLGTYR